MIITLPVSTVVGHTIKRMGQFFIYLFDFKQYLVQQGWFEWGPDEKEKQDNRQ